MIFNYYQKDATIFYYLFLKDSAHHQQHITVHSASGIVNQYYCRLVSWMRWDLPILLQAGIVDEMGLTNTTAGLYRE